MLWKDALHPDVIGDKCKHGKGEELVGIKPFKENNNSKNNFALKAKEFTLPWL